MARYPSSGRICPDCGGRKAPQAQRCMGCRKLPRRDIRERFMEKVSVVAETGCWEWLGYRENGYGRFSVSTASLSQKAHRVSYELHVGPIPEGLTLDHLCRNRACVNPAHLEPVPFATNVLRGESPPASNARKTHCPKGHPYDDENTLINPTNGYRGCRACIHERNVERARRRKEQRHARRCVA